MTNEELLRESLLRQKRDRVIAGAVVKGVVTGYIDGTVIAWGIIIVFLFFALIIF